MLLYFQECAYTLREGSQKPNIFKGNVFLIGLDPPPPFLKCNLFEIYFVASYEDSTQSNMVDILFL